MIAAIESLLPAGLRWRLTAWVAGVMVVSIAMIFVVVYSDTGSRLRGQIDRDLARDTAQLAQVVAGQRGAGTALILDRVSRYLNTQPYTATSTLLFALVGGEAASNHPEVFRAAPPENSESPREQAKENAADRRLLTPRPGYSTVNVPDVGRMRIHERSLAVGAVAGVAGAGEPLEPVRRAQQGVLNAFILAGAVTLAAALIASYLAGARVSAPLRRMAALAARVDAGELDPRMEHPGGRADEVRVLAVAFNHMLDRLAAAFASQREFVADASHELRTPLTVIRGQLEVLAARQSPSGSEVRRVERLVQDEINRLTRLVDDMLLLAQAEQTEFLRPELIELPSFLAELWRGLSLTADRRFQLGEVAKGRLRADPDRLAQALRNLARNAIDHTAEGSGLVLVEAEATGADRVRFAVTDDGPGIPPGERDRVFERFHRTDRGRSRSAGGAGLGLAIVRAIAQAHGGYVRAAEPSGHRGTRIELVLPGFEPS